MAIYRWEYKLIDTRHFGAVSQSQRPERVVTVRGWKVVGVCSFFSHPYCVFGRRVWFWQDIAARVIDAMAAPSTGKKPGEA